MRSFAFRFASLGLAIALISMGGLWSSGPVEAQTKGRDTSPPTAPRLRSAGEGQERLIPEDWSKNAAEMKQFQEIRKGTLPPTRGEVLDHAAQWYAYRLTH